MEPLGFPLDTVALFSGAFVFSLLVDLYQHRRHRRVTAVNAAAWSVFWIALSLSFYGWIRYRHGEHYACMFLTGYVLEKTLSVDNLMVFIAVFEFFKIHSGLQHRILYFGILGAIVFRAIFVGIGSGILMAVGPWAELVFGVVVAWAAIKMLQGREREKDEEPNYEEMGLVRFFRRFYPVFPSLVGSSFFIDRSEAEKAAAKHSPPTALEAGVKRWMTPAFVCLLVVEGSDVLFAFDSVPAVIAVTKEPLLVYTSMVFAVLGLRSLYFLLLILTRYLVHLEKAVILVLFFIAAKMFLVGAEHILHVRAPFEITPTASLFVVLGVLSLGVLASLVWPGEPIEGSPRSVAHGDD